jgi:hypothetical protein
MSHGTYIVIVIALAVLLLVWLLRRRVEDVEHEGEVRGEDHDVHPDDELLHPDLGLPVHEETGAPDLPLAPQPLGPPDDLTRLKGLGPRAQTQLNELGVTRYDQLAALDERQQAELDARLGTFKGRMARDRWIEQATLLTAGDTATYEELFGKLG